MLGELGEGRAQGIDLPDVRSLPWIGVISIPEPNVLRIVTDLGSGEREVLALGLITAEPLLLLDDSLARRHARLLRLPHTGTLGVLIRAKRAGRLDALRPVLDRLEALRFRLDPSTRRAVLELAEELGPTE